MLKEGGKLVKTHWLVTGTSNVRIKQTIGRENVADWGGTEDTEINGVSVTQMRSVTQRENISLP